jgi:hypothetical protein
MINIAFLTLAVIVHYFHYRTLAVEICPRSVLKGLSSYSGHWWTFRNSFSKILCHGNIQIQEWRPVSLTLALHNCHLLHVQFSTVNWIAKILSNFRTIKTGANLSIRGPRGKAIYWKTWSYCKTLVTVFLFISNTIHSKPRNWKRTIRSAVEVFF